MTLEPLASAQREADTADAAGKGGAELEQALEGAKSDLQQEEQKRQDAESQLQDERAKLAGQVHAFFGIKP